MAALKPKVNFKYSERVFHGVYCEPRDRQKWAMYRRDWRRVPEEHIVTGFPMHLDMDLTNVCNLSCPMCPRTQMLRRGMAQKPKYMKFETFKKAIDQSVGRGLYAVNLNASGEPLFNEDLTAMVRYAKQKGVADIMFHTNATRLYRKISEELISSGLNRLIVSFDSPVKEHYESIRKGARFEEVADNVNRFIRMRNEMGKAIPQVRINMVVMKENFDEQDMMIDFWKSRVDSIGFLRYVNFFHMDDEDRSVETEKGVYDSGFICEKLWQRLAITEDGQIKFCHLDDEGRLILGNIENDDIGRVWTGEKMNSYRKIHLNGKIKDIDLCAECGFPII